MDALDLSLALDGWRAHSLCGPAESWPERYWGPERLDPEAWRELAALLEPEAEREALVCALAGARDVIDVGGGTGLLARTLAERVGPVTVIEPSDEQRAHAPAGLTLRAGCAEALPCADGAADAAVATWVLQYTDDPDAAVAELARVARTHVAIIQAAPGNELVEVYNAAAAAVGLATAHHGFLLGRAAAVLEGCDFTVELTRIAIAVRAPIGGAAALADVLVRLHFRAHPAAREMRDAVEPLVAERLAKGHLADDGVLLVARR